MLDIIKKSLFTGLGLACLTKEKLEELSAEIIDRGNLSEREGKEFVAELSKRSIDAKERLELQVKTVVRDSLAKMDLATKEDIDLLEKKITQLTSLLQDKDIA